MAADADARVRLLRRLEARRAELEAVVSPLRSGGRLSALVDRDGTRVRDLLAHFACWQRVAERRLLTLGGGGQIQLLDTEYVNEHFDALTSTWTDDEVLTEFDAAYAAAMKVIESAPEAECKRGGYVYRYRRPLDGHYDDHLPSLRAVLEQ